jgi:hypothetical protein
VRITREYVFDMIEMVGKAITSARAKKDKAGPEWDLDGAIDALIHRWMEERDPLARKIREAAKNEDDRWGLNLGWTDSEPGGGVDDAPREKFSEWGSEKFEQRRAAACYDDFGDSLSCRLWKIQRQLSFKDIGVQEAFTQLIELCERAACVRYITKGWANRLLAILHAHSRG